MGYHIYQNDAQFTIKAKHHKKALSAIKSYFKSKSLAWIQPENVKECKTLAEALEECRWSADLDDEGNIRDLVFNGEKLGGDESLFIILAPFVEPGSYIEMRGEEGELWRWTFDGTTMEERYPTVSWDS